MKNNILNHIAIVMDGNSRWAKGKNISDSEGHKAGAKNALDLIPELIEAKIPNVTVYAFSTENWKRPFLEVSFLFELLTTYLDVEVDRLGKLGVKIKFIGDFNRIESHIIKKIERAIDKTKSNEIITVTVALSYGSRAEITNACQKIIDSGIKAISEEEFSKYLYDPTMPDVDLIIRPGGERRISNFLLWQSAYAELYFTDKLWPDFNKNDLTAAIEFYNSRARRFGSRT